MGTDKDSRLWECLLEVTQIKLLEYQEEEKRIHGKRLLQEKALKQPMVYNDRDGHDHHHNDGKRVRTNQKSKTIIYDDDDYDYVVDRRVTTMILDNNKTKNGKKSMVYDDDDDDDDYHHRHTMRINSLDNKKSKSDKRAGTKMAAAIGKNTRRNNENETGNKKKGGNEKKKKSNIKWNGPEPAPDMPIRMRDFITQELKGEEIQLVIQKALYDSDCKRGQNRLNIPEAQVINKEFLTEDEKKDLMMRDERKNNGCKAINVNLVDPQLRVLEIGLRRWEQNKNFNYVLSNPWINIVEKNNFHQGVVVQVWSFRVDSELGLAIVRVADGLPEEAEGGGSQGGGGGDDSDMGLGASSSGHGGGNVGPDMEE